MKTTEDPVVVEQSFNAPADAVWRAITELDRMKQWYFDCIPEYNTEDGFETRFNIESGGRNFMHLWKVTEAVPLKRLTYDWKYEGYSGDSFVTWELFEEGGNTTLRLTAKVREDFPDDIPEFKRKSCQAGWEYFIKQNLKGYLEGRSV